MALNKKIRYFILVTIMPIVGIIVIFSYAFFHIQDEIDVLSSKITALSIIKQLEEMIFDIQRTRGLSCIEKQSQISKDELELFRKSISRNLALLREKLAFIKEDDLLKNEFSEYLYFVQKALLKDMNFEEYTQIINRLMLFEHNIAYALKLSLEAELNEHILTNNIVYVLPELIEHNGQIRAIASSIGNKEVTQNQEKSLIAETEKIEEKLNILQNSLSLLYKTPEHYENIRKYHENMLQAQKSITGYIKDRLLDNNMSAESNDIFKQMTKNINAIITFYNSHINILNKSLRENRRLTTYVLIGGFLSMLFVIYVNILLFYKHRKFVNTIEELTITDAMTGLYNRRYFDEVFENSLKIQQRTKQTLVFIISDIDFFKEYNDTYGHQAGDEAIKMVASKLKSSLKRAGDMAFRLGGEEFGVLCIGMSEYEAATFANMIREEIENEKMEHEKNRAGRYLTVSMGIVIIEPDILSTTSDMYRCADKALYKAKEDGRNRVVVFDAKIFC